MIKLSIVVPAIRTHLWPRFYDSVGQACKKYSWEIIFVSPFHLPKELQGKNDVKLIQSYDTVPVCLQKGGLAAKGEMLLHSVDDCRFLPGALDSALAYFDRSAEEKDIVGMTYIENTNNMCAADKWLVRNLPEFDLPQIKKEWYCGVQPLMRLNRWFELGGIECQYIYSNHGHHSLFFRCQLDGGKVLILPFTASIADHMPERSGDHAPIHNSQTLHDEEMFKAMWSQDEPPPARIDYDHYKKFEGRWKDRFSAGEYTSYQELCEKEGYKI